MSPPGESGNVWVNGPYHHVGRERARADALSGPTRMTRLNSVATNDSYDKLSLPALCPWMLQNSVNPTLNLSETYSEIGFSAKDASPPLACPAPSHRRAIFGEPTERSASSRLHLEGQPATHKLFVSASFRKGGKC
jgi:hypothetical protein